jgi:polyisoprenoid-binding protein YceI
MHWRKWRWWLLGAAVLVAVLAVGGPFVYIHFIEGPAPAKLSLPNGGRGSESDSSPSSIASLGGVWNVGTGSIVGYRVQEELIGQQSTAVGRTTKVWGSTTIAGQSVSDATFTVNMASVVSDQSERNAQFDGRIMDVAEFPTAKFVLDRPIELGNLASEGAVKQYQASGELTMHGVTKAVDFSVSAERVGDTIYALADIPIVFADWNITNPSIGGFVTTQNSGTLEVLLHLTRGTGNPPSSGSSGSSSQTPGGPVTVPSTTVPTLQVPTS